MASVGEEAAQNEHLTDSDREDHSALPDAPPLNALVHVLRKRSACEVISTLYIFYFPVLFLRKEKENLRQY